jgi:hypothetical protein
MRREAGASVAGESERHNASVSSGGRNKTRGGGARQKGRAVGTHRRPRPPPLQGAYTYI